MSDLIDRQAAIDAVNEREWLTQDAKDILTEVIEQLPSVQPERKKGKWKRAYLDHEAMGERPSILYCSICNQCIAYPMDYCPNCGADMRGEGNETD